MCFRLEFVFNVGKEMEVIPTVYGINLGCSVYHHSC